MPRNRSSVLSAAPRDPQDIVVVVCNFTPQPRLAYRIGLPRDGEYHEILNSDAPRFGGSGVSNQEPITAMAFPWQNCAFSAELDLPPLGVIFLKP